MNYYLQIVLFIVSAIGICFILFRGLFFIIDKCSQFNGLSKQDKEDKRMLDDLAHDIEMEDTVTKPNTN